MAETPEEFYSNGAEKFADRYSLEDMPDDYINLMDSFVEKTGGGKVLDAGCGPGRDTQYFEERGLDSVGVDIAEGMIRHARDNKKGDFYEMDVRNLEFEDNFFQGVWCNTMMHFFTPEQMPSILAELKRVLKDGGVFYVSFKIGEGTFIRERYGSKVKQYLITEQKARKMLEEKGFRILETNKADIDGTEIMNILTEDKK